MKDYKKILEGVVNIINTIEKSDIGFANICTYIGENCPELAESKDESIRKELINWIEEFPDTIWRGHYKKDVISWLEQQGQTFTKKDIDDAYLKGVCDAKRELEKKCEQKTTDKVEPKFKIGDIITNGKIIGKVDENENNKYHGWFGYDKDLSVYYADIPDVENWHLWTIQDAKDGDVLANKYGDVMLFKGMTNDRHICGYCQYSAEDRKLYNECSDFPNYYPSTKEQSDLLFQKMKEAGYEWDAEKKELKKIEQKPVDWSEEDERIKNNCISFLGFNKEYSPQAECIDECINWLKSLRPQNRCTYNPYKEVVESITEMCKHYDNMDVGSLQDFYDNVKVKCKDAKEYDSLFPQNTRKPSDEHYELEEFAKIVRGNLTGISKAVQKLFEAKYLQLTGNKMYGGFKD